MHFERDVCLSCDWRRIDLAASSRARAAHSMLDGAGNSDRGQEQGHAGDRLACCYIGRRVEVSKLY